MIEYIKIETPFERDTDGTKKLIDGKFRSKAVEYLYMCYAQWEWTEKIDGTNIAIEWDGHNISFHGRTERAEIPKYLLTELETIFSNNETEELFEQMFGETPMWLYGEGYGGKIQGHKDYRETPSFILFDVYKPENDVWLSRDAVREIAKSIGIDAVPVVLTCASLDQAIEFVKSKPKSTIGTADMEGLVGRPLVELKDNQGKRIIVKVKVRDFE